MAIWRAHRATVVAPYELAEHFAAQGASTLDLIPGGGGDLPWGRMQMTPAIHSSALELPHGENRAMDVPSGCVVRTAHGTLYHAGDTALFGDMQLMGRHGLDVALIPIGDYHTMGPADALEALNFLRPRPAVPMHYNSKPKFRQDPHAFAQQAIAAGHAVRVLATGERLDI